MPRVQDILISTRDRLADADGDRFSDDMLLRLLNQQIALVCSGSNLLKTKTVIYLNNGQSEYAMPDDCLSLTRVLGNEDQLLRVLAHNDMDSELSKRGLSTSWETDIGTDVKRIIFDRINPHTLKVYPIPATVTDISGIENVQGTSVIISNEANVIARVHTNYVHDRNFGIASDVEGYKTDLFGLVVAIDDEVASDTDKIDKYGFMSSWSTETSKKLTVYYTRKPKIVTDVKEDLDFETTFDIPLSYFLACEALLINQDTESVGRAKNFLTLGQKSLEQFSKNSSTNLASVRTYSVQYATGFE